MSEVLIRNPLPWQQSNWQDWLRQLAAQRLPHAVLIRGQAGLGKSRLAQGFAQSLLCLAAVEQRPCGQCKGCRLLQAGSHPDLRLIGPEKTGRAIKIDQIRDLLRFVGETSQQGGWKVVIIEPADAMNTHAANALLKSLEEPPGETLLILVSSRPGRLLATLRSRCRQVQVTPPSRGQALEWLEPRLGQQAADFLDYAHGAPCAALQASESDGLAQRRDMEAQLLALALGQVSAVTTARALESSGDLDQLLALLDQIARAQVGQRGFRAQDPAAWEALIERIRPDLLFRYRDKLLQAKGQLLSGANPNAQLLWETLMFDWQALVSGRSGPRDKVAGGGWR